MNTFFLVGDTKFFINTTMNSVPLLPEILLKKKNEMFHFQFFFHTNVIGFFAILNLKIY